jgi:hypothetical protein
VPFAPESFDAVFFRHAIADIVETRGRGSIPLFVDEGMRIVRSGGLLAFSHAVLPEDPFTKMADLEDIIKVLPMDGEKVCIRGDYQSWLVYEKS